MNSLIRPKDATSEVNRIPLSLRRFGAGLAEQARLRAKFAAAVAVATTATLAASPALAEKPTTAEKQTAARSTYLITDSTKPEGRLIEGDQIDEKLLPAQELCESCVIEVRCPQAVVREDVPFKRAPPSNEGIIRMRVPDVRGKTVTLSCKDDEIDAYFLYIPRYEDPIGPPLPPLVPIGIPTPPSPPPPDEPVSHPEETPAPPAPPEETVSRFAPVADKGPPPVFLTFLNMPDQELTEDTIVRRRENSDARLELRCPEGDAPIFDPTPDPEDLQFGSPPSTWVSAPIGPMNSLKVQCGDGQERVITVVDIAPEEPRQWSLEAGTEIPVASTHDFFSTPGAYVQGTGRPLRFLGDTRGTLRVAWNPVTQRPADDNPTFAPRNPRQKIRGNAVRVTAGLLYPHELMRRDRFSLDAQGGLDIGVALLNVGAHKDVGVDRDGNLADIPAYNGLTAVVEGHGELVAHFGERLRVALGLRYGQSPFAAQTKAAASNGARFNFVNVNASAGLQF